MATLEKEKTRSTLLLDEYFEEGDDRFLDAVRECTADGKLKAVAGRWYSDRRPWARKMYVSMIDAKKGAALYSALAPLGSG